MNTRPYRSLSPSKLSMDVIRWRVSEARHEGIVIGLCWGAFLTALILFCNAR